MFWLRQLLVATLGFLQNQTVGIKTKYRIPESTLFREVWMGSGNPFISLPGDSTIADLWISISEPLGQQTVCELRKRGSEV